MANVKQNQTQEAEVKKNRLLEVFSKEYKYEGLVLLVLSAIAIILGALILAGKNETTSGTLSYILWNGVSNAFLLEKFPVLFAIILIVLGGFAFILSVWPYYKPSIYEVKRVTWPTKKTMIQNCIDVVIYSASLAVFFYVCDILLQLIVSAL